MWTYTRRSHCECALEHDTLHMYANICVYIYRYVDIYICRYVDIYTHAKRAYICPHTVRI